MDKGQINICVWLHVKKLPIKSAAQANSQTKTDPVDLLVQLSVLLEINILQSFYYFYKYITSF